MKKQPHRLIATALLAAGMASVVGCYPAYPPPDYSSAYNQDAKDGSMPQEPLPPPQPRYVGVDPGLVIAGVAAAGILGYALGDHHHHGGYYGPRYYARGPYYRGGGYYGPRYYR